MVLEPLVQGTADADARDRPILSIRGLRVRFRGRGGLVHAVNGVDLDVEAGRTLCVIGESGSGKSVMLRAVLRLDPPARTETEGSVRLGGRELVGLPEPALRRVRGRKVAMIFQDPGLALDPVYPIGSQIVEAIRVHLPLGRAGARARAMELLDAVRIPAARARFDAFPHELSGGMRQRAMIALALACGPDLLLADEPTTALDATVQIQVLDLLRELQESLGMAILLVTHDVGVAAEIAHTIAVMYAGQVVEEAPADAVLQAPAHPYARALLAARVSSARRGEILPTLPGAPPRLAHPPAACAFAPRCSQAQPRCSIEPPPWRRAGVRAARCVLAPETR